MHEMSIAQNIIEIVQQHLPSEEVEVKSVKMKIGELAGIVIDSLEFCYSAMTKETKLEHAVLEIENIPIKISCNLCDTFSQLEFGMFICSHCGRATTAIQSRLLSEESGSEEAQAANQDHGQCARRRASRPRELYLQS